MRPCQWLQAPASFPDEEVNAFTTGAWAKRFPSEMVWKLRKVAAAKPASLL
jgi:hypothetical protein